MPAGPKCSNYSKKCTSFPNVTYATLDLVDKANQAKHHTEIAIVTEEAANNPKSVGSQRHFMNFQERQPGTGSLVTFPLPGSSMPNITIYGRNYFCTKSTSGHLLKGKGDSKFHEDIR
jgi:hypothetical protein